MTQQQSFRNNPSNPAAQPFNINGNRTSKKGWWRKGASKTEKGGNV